MLKKGIQALSLLTAGIISSGCSNHPTSYFYGTRPTGEKYAYSISDINGDEKPDLLGIVSGRVPSSNEEFSKLLQGIRGLDYFTSKFNPEITVLGTSEMIEKYMRSPAYRVKVNRIVGPNVPIYQMPSEVQQRLYDHVLSVQDFKSLPSQATYWQKLNR